MPAPLLAFALLLTAPGGDPAPTEQYKRVHPRALEKIWSGRAREAVDELGAFLESHPDDAETHFALCVARTRLGALDAAADHMHRALELGLPPSRFLLGSHAGLEPLREHPAWRELAERRGPEALHGPMLGCLGPRGVRMWMRAAEHTLIRVVVDRSPDLDRNPLHSAARSDPQRDCTSVVQVGGLEPGTRYHYAVLLGPGPGGEPVARGSFVTAPETGAPCRIRVAFGGGAGFVPEHERVWDAIRSFEPDALLLLGDNVYIDSPESPRLQRYGYHRRQARPEFRRLVGRTPVYAIWDDHDFGTNDCSGGPLLDEPAWKLPVWRTFRDNWCNPSFGGGQQQPGCWFDFHLGDVHFILLDGRFWRTPGGPDGRPATMLGPAQKSWLLERLRSSRATFKLLCSPVPWVLDAKGDSPDTWRGFREERLEIFDLLARERVTGVILLSADRHRSDRWKIERESGYPLHELSSSRLTNQHTHPTMAAAEFSYNRTPSFGLIDIDTTLEDPTATYRIVTLDGEVVHTFALPLSRLGEEGR